MPITKMGHHRAQALVLILALSTSLLPMASGVEVFLRGANDDTKRAKRILQMETKRSKRASNAGAPHQSGIRDESPPITDQPSIIMAQPPPPPTPPPTASTRFIPTENVEKFTYVIDSSVPSCVKRSYAIFPNHIAVETYKQDASSGKQCLEDNKKVRASRISIEQYQSMLRKLRRYIKECDPDPSCTPCAGAASFKLDLYQDSLIADAPSFAASLDSCPQQCGTGGACGDPQEFERIVIARERAARRQMRRMQFNRRKSKRVEGIEFAVEEGSFPCANATKYSVEARSIVMTKTNIGFEGGGCEKIEEEMTVPITQKEFRQLRNLLSKYKIKRCAPDFEAELRGTVDDSVGGEYYALVLLSANGADLFDSNGSDLCGDTASFAASLTEYF